MRLPLRYCPIFVLGALWCGPGLSQETALSQKHHPWGRFAPGAWKVVRVVTETLDESDHVTSTNTSETTTILKRLDQDGVVLEVQVTGEVAGKRVDGEPQIFKQGFHGEPIGPELKIKEPVAGQVLIEGRKIPCRIQQVELAGAAGKTVTSISYSDTVAPYVLRREAVSTDLEGKTTLGETTVEVEARDMPWRVAGEIRNAAVLRTVQKNAKGTVITWAICASDVPGGMVSHSSKELDKTGRLIRRSTMDLVDYGLQCQEEKEKPSMGVFGRRRRPRFRETTTHVTPR
jgi:hypothetical protein